MTTTRLVAGIDEAGRGPLAGPVVAAAVVFRPGGTVDGLGDSKALSEARREKLLPLIHAAAFVGVGIAEPEEIDRINILQATMIAMCRALWALPVRPDRALIDIAARFEGLAGPVFKSSRRLAVSHLVAPVFGAHGVPIFEVELLVLAGDTTRPRRLRLAAALRNSAHALALQSGGAIP